MNLEEDHPYLTIEEPSEGLFKAKGSKHFGYIFPLANVDEVKTHLDALRLLHPSAGHHAFAYRLGAQGDQWRSFDDGEPNNTAGPPILGALRSHNLTHCMGVVVRYFGGTKLGVGGLIEAYREAVNEAILHAVVIERYPVAAMTVVFPYAQLGPVMSMLKRHQVTPLHPDFQLTCTMQIESRKSTIHNLKEALARIPEVLVTPLE